MEIKQIQTIIEELLSRLPVKIERVEVSEVEGRSPIFSIRTGDAPLLIGTHGAHFQALSLLIKKIVAAKAEAAGQPEPKFFIDVNDYRAALASALATKANILAERARSLRADVEMEPMTAYERLIVHECLADAKDLKTESIGEGKNRRIVIRFSEGSSAI